jgi:predicted alpha/beta hydrolase family esterase
VPGLAGALLVAPSDVERADAAAVLREFGPVPRARLGFPAQVVVSDDDPYVELARARAFAEAWGAGLTVVPGAGHLNVASGHGEWPAGLELLRQLALTPAA